MACLCVVAAFLGYGAYKIISNSEKKLAEEHFDATAERALDEALHITLRKRLGAKALASVASFAFPNAATWPNVSLFGFEGIAATIMDTDEAKTMGLCPLVWPDQLAEFEEFAYTTAFRKVNWHYPNSTGLKDLNLDGIETRGVHGFDQTFTAYRETDGKSDWNSTYDVITPFIMHSAGPPILMFNIHSMTRCGTIIDQLLDCAMSSTSSGGKSTDQDGADVDDLSDISYLNICATLSDIMEMYDKGA
jgi:hypothetical protein